METHVFTATADTDDRPCVAVYHVTEHGALTLARLGKTRDGRRATEDDLSAYAVQITYVYPNGDVKITGLNRTDET